MGEKEQDKVSIRDIIVFIIVAISVIFIIATTVYFVLGGIFTWINFLEDTFNLWED